MSWGRKQFRSEVKQPRHARVSLSGISCADCNVELPATFPIAEHDGRCRHCFSSLYGSAPFVGGEQLVHFEVVNGLLVAL
ncbi:hypothetical protein [Ktedonobacter robiniae]|uniref:Paraquat-inducible protein A n=1 Tax=Ktedonobacter robiniae TaxID=2778365 RepID=A0ABQ3UJI2_9CHLR|nr:hypothetical protein [Ktedonobacter robiniae]GHO52889.1 hypothetical protein KSB_13640 [Ktedonobacter robiniae]